MKFLLSLVSVLFWFSSFGQAVRIDSLKLQNEKTDKLIFPIVKTENAHTDSLINADLRYRFTDEDSSITEWAINDITYLDFDVTYNKNGILSLNISAEACAAYCSEWTDYYNYSTTTGKALTIDDIVDTSKDFLTLIKTERTIQFEKQKGELVERLNNPKTETDSSTYEYALDRYNECESNLSIKSFVLYDTHLEIIDDCEFPHVVRSLTPIIELRYSYSSLKKFLKRSL